jgi:polysaccharide pyruvyl transferase WcaK-like protein
MNITVLGWYDHGNCGDESYKIAFPLLFPNHTMTFVDHPDKVPSHTNRIFVGGGDVLRRPFTTKIKDFTSKGIPVTAVSVTITPDSEWDSLSYFDKLLIRDGKSLDITRDYPELSSKCFYMPDFSFALTPNKEHGNVLLKQFFEKNKKELKDKVIVIVLNDYIAFNDNNSPAKHVWIFNRLALKISETIQDMDASFVFLPFSTMSPWDDRAISAWVCDKVKKNYLKNLVIYDVLGVKDTLNIIASADVVISSRLHSTIFSAISSVPFIDITHHDKNMGFLKTLGKEDWSVSFWDFDTTKFQSLLNYFINERIGGQEPSLQQFTRQARDQLSHASEFILQ